MGWLASFNHLFLLHRISQKVVRGGMAAAEVATYLHPGASSGPVMEMRELGTDEACSL